MKRYILFWAHVASESQTMISFYEREKAQNETMKKLNRVFKSNLITRREYAITRLIQATKDYEKDI